MPYLQAAPSTEHQRILANLAFELMKYFRGNDSKCEVFLAPFDVRLIKNIQYYEVKEYWIVSPKNKDIQIFRLNKEIYGEPDNFKKGEIIKSKLFDALEVNLLNVFAS